MRWPFSRRASSTDALEAAPVAAAPAAPEAWRQLEPLRTLRHVELTADGRRFSRGLGARRPAELSLRPLGHDLSPAAPQGLVSNLARTVVPSERELDLPVVPSRRERPPPVVTRPRQQAAVSVLDAAEPVVLQATAPAVASEPPEQGGEPVRAPAPEPSPAPAVEPLRPARARRLDAVERPTATIAERRSELPVVPRPLPIAPPVGATPVRTAAAESPPVEPVAALEPEAPLVAPPRAPQLPTVGTRLEPTIGPAAVAPPPLVEHTGPAPVAPPDLPLPVPRRPGLGAPILVESPAEAVRPLVSSAPTPTTTGDRVPLAPEPHAPISQPEVGPVGPVVPPRPGTAASPPEPTPEPARAAPPTPPTPAGEEVESAPLTGALEIRRTDPAPLRDPTPVRPQVNERASLDLPLALPSRPPAPPNAPESSPPRAPEPAPVRPLAAVATAQSSPTRPLAGATPLASAGAPRSVQRRSEPTPPRPSLPASSTSPLPSTPPRRALRSTSREGIAPPAAMPERPPASVVAAAPVRPADTPSPPRRAADSLSVTPASATARRLAAVSDATVPATSPTSPSATFTPSYAASAAPVAAPWTAPMRTREAPVPVAPPAPAPPALPAAHPRSVQRAVEIDELQVTSTVAPPPATPAPATTQAPAAGSGAPAAAPGAPADPEQLREQVLRWVRAELLVNRERAGRLTDLR